MADSEYVSACCCDTTRLLANSDTERRGGCRYALTLTILHPPRTMIVLERETRADTACAHPTDEDDRLTNRLQGNMD
jgi:hypothetical protein